MAGFIRWLHWTLCLHLDSEFMAACNMISDFDSPLVLTHHQLSNFLPSLPFSPPPGSVTPPPPLSKGAVVGIVLGIISAIAAIVLLCVYWRVCFWSNRHQYDWYNKLTTPSEWCDGVSCPELSCPRLPRLSLASRRTRTASHSPPIYTQVRSVLH